MYFAIQRSDDGQYWWRAVGDNNEIMAFSELMHRKESVEHAISVIRTEAADARVIDQSEDWGAEQARRAA